MEDIEEDVKPQSNYTLTAEEEIELAQRGINGDVEAQQKLVMANVNFVHYIIKTCYNITQRLEYEDAYQYGILGLVEASKRYDGKHNCRFSTYAKHWIKKMINKYIYNQAPLVRVPPSPIKLIHGLYSLTNKLQEYRPERELHVEDVAEGLGIDSGLVTSVKAAFKGAHCECDDLNDSDSENVIESDAMSGEVMSLLETLEPMQRDIICRYYGIGCPPQTLQDISMVYILSKERIRQIKKETLESLRTKIDPTDKKE